MPLHYEAAVIWWVTCVLCPDYKSEKILDELVASKVLGDHMNTEHPGWEKKMIKMQNGIDPAQQTIEEIAQ